MLSTSNVLIVGALFCVLMLLVLTSMLRCGFPGVRAWCLANLLGMIALVLYAYGLVLPPWIGYEVANGVYSAAGAAVLVGYRRFLGARIPWLALGSGIAAVVVAVAVFHYHHDSFALRTMAVALFQGSVCLGIVVTVLRARARWRSNYPYYFTIGMAGVFAAGHAVRTVLYFLRSGEITSLLQPSGWNLFFVSAGTFILPVLTIGAVMMVHDAMMARAEHAANRDFLTGAWSRRAFFELAAREQARARRTQRPLCLLLLDIDHFKHINDSAGHAAGDQVLIDAVTCAATVVRTVDYFARVGGEEFAVLLPETGLAAATVVAERLRAALDRSVTLGAGRLRPLALHYTVSIGLAECGEGEDMQDLMRRADAALYAAKQGGRNQVVVAPGVVGLEAQLAATDRPQSTSAA